MNKDTASKFSLVAEAGLVVDLRDKIVANPHADKELVDHLNVMLAAINKLFALRCTTCAMIGHTKAQCWLQNELYGQCRDFGNLASYRKYRTTDSIMVRTEKTIRKQQLKNERSGKMLAYKLRILTQDDQPITISEALDNFQA